MKNNFFKIILLSTTLSLNVLAADVTTDNSQKTTLSKPSDKAATTPITTTEDHETTYQKIIDDFKKYMLTVKPEIKDEIKEFRQNIKDLNEQKKQAYIKLTTEAQNYLKNEKTFKQKLPINKRKDLIDVIKEHITPDQKTQKDSTAPNSK